MDYGLDGRGKFVLFFIASAIMGYRGLFPWDKAVEA
jgi:hypothetical protein